jgi:hypothetical protein
MAMSGDLLTSRDRALLVLGCAGVFRRSALVAVDVEALRFSPSGLFHRRRREGDTFREHRRRSAALGDHPRLVA